MTNPVLEAKVKELAKQYPNDMELGKATRAFMVEFLNDPVGDIPNDIILGREVRAHLNSLEEVLSCECKRDASGKCKCN